MPDSSATQRFLRNLASMTVFQASGYILGMINVPYLTRMLGVTAIALILAEAIHCVPFLALLCRNEPVFTIDALRSVTDAPRQVMEVFETLLVRLRSS